MATTRATKKPSPKAAARKPAARKPAARKPAARKPAAVKTPTTTAAEKAAGKRKERSEKLMRKLGAPVNATLPTITLGTPRPGTQIADRAIALLGVAMKAMRAPAALQASFGKAFKVAAKLSPLEKAFWKAEVPSEHDRLQLGWRVEALGVLLWSIGIVDKLTSLDTQVAPQAQLARVLEFQCDTGLRAAAVLRGSDELLELADQLYRAHWATRDAKLHGKRPPAALSPGIVLERDYAIRWVIGQGGAAWDDVRCDT